MKPSIRVMSVWRRGKAKVNRLLGNAPPDTSVKHESNYSTTSLTLLTHPPTPAIYPPAIYPPTPPTRSPTPPTRSPTPPTRSPTPPNRSPTPPTRPLTPSAPPPYDIAEMIIAHLTHDIPTLKTCTLTCRSLSIAAAPHLYRILTLTGGRPEIDRSRLEPLSKLHELGLMPFVREIRVKQGKGSSSWLVPQAFSHLDLRHFSAFANVHTLKIQNMEVYRFIPDIERYFEHFSPTLRSITLYNPCCTSRQLSYFLSIFSNLDDINISHATVVPNTIVPYTELVPFSTPKLQGSLTLYMFQWIDTWTRLRASSGSLRFRHMDIRRSLSCERVLFESCAKTLETLRLYVNDRSAGEWFCADFVCGFELMVNRTSRSIAA